MTARRGSPVRRASIPALLLLALVLGPRPVGAQEEPEGQGDSAAGASAAPPDGQPGAPSARPPAEQQALQRTLSPPAPASAEPSADVPPGTIRVRVLDATGAPVPDARVDVGVLAQGGDRERTEKRTDETGVAVYEGLPTGADQAYRANVRYRGAVYSSTPFRLPPDRGYDVQLRQLPVTRDNRTLFQRLGQTQLEVRDKRLHVIHRAEIANAGAETVVLPADGLRVELPEGYLNFQAQSVMTDQRVTEEDGAVRIRGSFPPGRVSLAWAYDLRIEGGSLAVPVQIPFPTFRYQVVTAALDGLELEVAGMPAATRHDLDGQDYLLSFVERGPGDAPFDAIEVRLTGLPTPGPGRWVALATASLFALLGLAYLIAASVGSAPRGSAQRRKAAKAERRARREGLLAEARELAEALANDEVGPEYAGRRRREIVEALAELRYQDSLAKARRETASDLAGSPPRAAASRGALSR